MLIPGGFGGDEAFMWIVEAKPPDPSEISLSSTMYPYNILIFNSHFSILYLFLIFKFLLI